jgi:polysaccharide deacetylase family sporulation protein PdaB
MVRYWIIGKKGLAILCGCILLLITLGAMGARKIAVDVSAQLKTLPIYSVETENQEKKLALGINCAWGNEDIPAILKILEEEKIKATFFVVGDWCAKYPDTVRQIHERGHEIGNHSDSHPDMANLSEEKIRQEIENCSLKVEQATGQKPNLFRCPSGSYNNRVIETVKEMGYYPIQWSLDSLDWKGKTAEEMEARILPKLTYGDILLFHNDTKYTKDALQGIIQKIKDKGYSFVTVGELIYKGEYRVDVTGRQRAE